jgi:hypothetical protein
MKPHRQLDSKYILLLGILSALSRLMSKSASRANSPFKSTPSKIKSMGSNGKPRLARFAATMIDLGQNGFRHSER